MSSKRAFFINKINKLFTFHSFIKATIAPESIVAVSALGASKDVFVKMVKYIMQAINPPAVLYFGRKFKELKVFEDKIIYFGTFDDKFDTSNKKEI